MKHDASNYRKSAILLRDVVDGDLPVFFEHQRDPAANLMAAFPARDREAFMAHWTKILGKDAVITKTIVFQDEIVGNIVCFEQSGRRLIGYWIGRESWGKGIATKALSDFLGQVRTRPLHAHVVKHNVGSIRVLEKCGFVRSEKDSSPEEFVFTLPSNRETC